MPIAAARALIGDGGMLRQVEVRCHLTRPVTQIGIALLIVRIPHHEWARMTSLLISRAGIP